MFLFDDGLVLNYNPVTKVVSLDIPGLKVVQDGLTRAGTPVYHVHLEHKGRILELADADFQFWSRDGWVWCYIESIDLKTSGQTFSELVTNMKEALFYLWDNVVQRSDDYFSDSLQKNRKLVTQFIRSELDPNDPDLLTTEERKWHSTSVL